MTVLVVSVEVVAVEVVVRVRAGHRCFTPSLSV